jgi:hypothetical protein
MTLIYLLESNPTKMKSKSLPPFSIFCRRTYTQSRLTVRCLEEDEGGNVSKFLYISHNSDGHSDISIACRYYVWQ